MSEPVSFDRVAEVYDETRVLPQDVMDRAIERLLATFQKRDCRWVLDAGTGTGRFAKPMQAHGLRVVGIDVAGKMLARARAKSVKDLILGEIGRMPFRDKCFDATVTVHVLHLIKDWRRALKEIERVTRRVYSSIVSIWPDDPWPGQVYEDLLVKYGWPETHPGLRERDLPTTIAPLVKEEIASFVQEKEADKSLEQLQQRCYSSQWRVPESLHQRVMVELRKEFGGGTLKAKAQVFLYVWDVGRLASL